MAIRLAVSNFSSINLDDPFFDSLKADYAEFPAWFAKKGPEPVIVAREELTGKLSGFVYLKVEDGALTDVSPHLPPKRRLKVGTLKIIAHGTKLGERVLKKVFDRALAEKVDEIYVTIFAKHVALIKLFKRYGFSAAATKSGLNGEELVLVRSLEAAVGDIILDYPLVHTSGVKKFLLAIYPQYHTALLPASILHTEKPHIVEDVSHTNTIHKVYIARIPLVRLLRGGIVVMYRTSDKKGPAYFRSVATSVCVIESVKAKKDFENLDDFLSYTRPHSVFSDEDLEQMYVENPRLYVARMTYNAAFQRRPTRGELMGLVGISEQPRWDFRRLTDEQFAAILALGKVDEGLIVD